MWLTSGVPNNLRINRPISRFSHDDFPLMCYAPIKVREIVASPTGWRQSPKSPDPERKPVFRRLKEEKGQAQLHCSSTEDCSVRSATFRPSALSRQSSKKKDVLKREIQ